MFSRCCEKTMAVMRNNQEALLTIVEVSIMSYFLISNRPECL